MRPIADLGQLVWIQPRDFFARQTIAAVGGAIEAAQDIHQRRFAGAGRADQGDELTLQISRDTFLRA